MQPLYSTGGLRGILAAHKVRMSGQGAGCPTLPGLRAVWDGGLGTGAGDGEGGRSGGEAGGITKS